MLIIFIFTGAFTIGLFPQSKLLIPMDLNQSDHLKAYGITYRALTKGYKADWLINYRSGSFFIDFSDDVAVECRVEGVLFEEISFSDVTQIYAFVQSEENNMDVIRLEQAPKIAVYVPPGFQPWDDAVTLALEYASVPYDKIWNDEIIKGDLDNYDWLHLHHEDFTGQYGKFYASFSNAQWYVDQQLQYEHNANKNGYRKVSDMLKTVAVEIRNYVGKGGFLFAMCSATDSYDIALSALSVDIAETMYDGDAADPNAQEMLNFNNTLAFTDFKVEMNPYIYEYSDIDIQPIEIGNFANDYFTLFEFSAKYDPVPTMLTQSHANVIRGFMGQTTMFRRSTIKSSVIVMAERKDTDQVKYIHGNYGRGTFTFYGGHDPEDYQHAVGDPPTDLNLHKNSPGYRLILNNILFPAATKKKQKT
ncbi:MAG: asparagine synthetase B [Ignavibacteria bacterium]|nr:asparagine synthetase B [Ignavibacteria bacterium]MBT8390787.1 asparagine synthetase B [Ignavibacteria bacterium]NNL20159.1 asparagine synthetase B [Ignavibacteriaceae bacterium]